MTAPPRTPAPAEEEDDRPDPLATSPARTPRPAPVVRTSRPGTKLLVALWAFVVIFGMGVELYALEPYFQAREQRIMLESYRNDISIAVNQTKSVFGVDVPTKAPELGAPVGIIEIGGTEQAGLGVQQVMVEGALPSQTQAGPGHVPGTAGPGQPGNSVIVGRHSAFGGPFGDIGYLQQGSLILVSTIQGQSVYRVESVREQTIIESRGNGNSDATRQSSVADEKDAAADPLAESTVPVDVLYGATPDDRLTLVTSANSNPFNSSDATVVVAKMQRKPYEPTPQNGRVDSQTGLGGDPSAWAPVILVLLAYGAAVVGAIVLYQRSSSRAAYLLTVPPLLVFTILTAETVSRLLPAWL